MQQGWIKLHRQFRDNPYYKEPRALSVWIECLMRANHAESKQLLKRQMVKLEAGQFVMGGKEFGESIGVAKSTVWYWLGVFEADAMLDTKKTTKGTIITVKNWNKYQSTDALLDTNGTQMGRKKTHHKNVKNVKNDKKKTLSKDKGATPRTYSDGSNIILLKDETMSSIDDRDRSFPRKRIFGNEKIDWTLDYLEYRLGRKLTGQERWNRIYAGHLARKVGMGKLKPLLDWLTEPDNWWFDKIGQVGTIYKNVEKLQQQIKQPEPKQKFSKKITFIS